MVGFIDGKNKIVTKLWMNSSINSHKYIEEMHELYEYVLFVYVIHIQHILLPKNQLNPESIKYSAHTKQMYHEKYDLKIKEYRQDMNS